MEQMTAGRKASGFASPALGYENKGIDLNSLLIKQPAATYFFRLDSRDMAGLGLPQGALLVVDRSKVPVPKNIVLIRHEGRFLCRYMIKQNGYTVFSNGVSEISPLDDDTEIIGVVTSYIKEFDNDLSY